MPNAPYTRRLSSARTPSELSELARRHLWMHFAGLGGLFTVQVGHGRRELAEAAREQAEQLAYFPIWNYAHPPAIELAGRVADLAPGDLNRVFFTSGGAEAVESTWKPDRQYFRAI